MFKRGKIYDRATTITITVLLMVSSLILFSGCGKEPADADLSSEEAITLSFHTGMSTGHYFCADLVPQFISDVEERTEGRVRIDFYPAEELMGWIEGIDAVVYGNIDMALTSHGHWGGYDPVFLFSDQFALIRDNDHFYQAYAEMEEVLKGIYEDQNVKPLIWAAYGGNNLLSRSPIDSVNDMRGKLIRAPVPGALASIEALGATPARIALPELYDALDKGAIDAAVTSWDLTYTMGYGDITDYFVGPVWYTGFVIFINNDKWNSIPADLQEIILEVSQETQNRSVELAEYYDSTYIEKLKEHGDVRLITPKELDEWYDILKPAYENWLENCRNGRYGTEAEQIFNALLNTR